MNLNKAGLSGSSIWGHQRKAVASIETHVRKKSSQWPQKFPSVNKIVISVGGPGTATAYPRCRGRPQLAPSMAGLGERRDVLIVPRRILTYGQCVAGGRTLAMKRQSGIWRL
ncbi:hypothetical protein FCN80_06070 [Martelella alba]|uniref:Uncharacterized protein n=1 Tax=Martelella alba TaxID=2590451 RepID=A0ABY2SQ57_9HYPH|nr:hypothetical protein FCN80_06070 [Martelella alba]